MTPPAVPAVVRRVLTEPAAWTTGYLAGVAALGLATALAGGYGYSLLLAASTPASGSPAQITEAQNRLFDDTMAGYLRWLGGLSPAWLGALALALASAVLASVALRPAALAGSHPALRAVPAAAVGYAVGLVTLLVTWLLR